VARDRRLYLFDIDGTLINTGGAGSAAMRDAFDAVWGSGDAAFQNIEFSGRTDRAIFRNVLTAAGRDLSDTFAADLARFKRAYFRRIGPMLRARRGEVLPGVVDLLRLLNADDRATVSLGTGNFRWSGLTKLRHYGIDSHFRGGGFGDRSEERALLIAEGIRAADRAAGRHATVFVIGDTIHDMTAAKANNAVAIGVLTGPADEATLVKAGADLVLPTLTGAERYLQARSLD
jgi:phosphoglycolate phosphatase-like HAD superfamily hydrolase